MSVTSCGFSDVARDGCVPCDPRSGVGFSPPVPFRDGTPFVTHASALRVIQGGNGSLGTFMAQLPYGAGTLAPVIVGMETRPMSRPPVIGSPFGGASPPILTGASSLPSFVVELDSVCLASQRFFERASSADALEAAGMGFIDRIVAIDQREQGVVGKGWHERYMRALGDIVRHERKKRVVGQNSQVSLRALSLIRDRVNTVKDREDVDIKGLCSTAMIVGGYCESFDLINEVSWHYVRKVGPRGLDDSIRGVCLSSLTTVCTLDPAAQVIIVNHLRAKMRVLRSHGS